MMLTQRLDNLETELKLLLTMHDLLESDADNESGNDGGAEDKRKSKYSYCDEVPERDTSHKTKKDGNIKDPPLSSEKSYPSANKEVSLLEEELKKERALRAEVEESAKHVYVQLQKTQNEVQREREMKENHLIESLQLKSLVEQRHAEMAKLEQSYNESQSQARQLEARVQKVTSEKANLVQRLFYLCQELGYRNDYQPPTTHHHQEQNIESYLNFLKTHFQNLRKLVTAKDVGEDQRRKLTAQLNSLVGRCATLEKERDRVKAELEESRQREEYLKNQLHACTLTVTTAEAELLKKQIEYECTLQKAQADFQTEKQKFSQKLADCSAVIRRSKELLLSLRGERDQSEQRLQQMLRTKDTLELQLKTVVNEKQELAREKERLWEKLEDVRGKEGHWQLEKMALEQNVRKHQAERRKCMELLGSMKQQLLSWRQKCTHDTSLFSVEKETLESQRKRLDENLRVLQKISEDQGHTVTKLRREIEDLKAVNFKLDSQARDHESTEAQLIRKLEQAEKQSERYVRQIDELQEKVQRYADDLRSHNCSNFVDSQYRRKVEKLEETLEEKMEEWQRTFKNLTRDKEEAVGLSHSLQTKMEELKTTHEKTMQEWKGKVQVEVGRLQESHRKQVDEKMAKIQQLQSELDHVKASSSENQRALSAKVQQLQAALSLCLGSTSPPAQQLQNPSIFHPSSHNNHSHASSRNHGCCGVGVGVSMPNLLNMAGGQHTCPSGASQTTEYPNLDFISSLLL